MGASGLGTLLVKEGFLTEQDRATITKTCGQGSWAFAKSILAIGLLDEDELAAFFAERTKYTIAPKDFLSHLDQSALQSFDKRMLSRLEILPIRRDDDKITVAVVDPLDKGTLKQLEFFTGLNVVPVIVPLSQLYEGLMRVNAEFQPSYTALSQFLQNHVGSAWVRQRVQTEDLSGALPIRGAKKGSAQDFGDDDLGVEEVDLDDDNDVEEVPFGEDDEAPLEDLDSDDDSGASEDLGASDDDSGRGDDEVVAGNDDEDLFAGSDEQDAAGGSSTDASAGDAEDDLFALSGELEGKSEDDDLGEIDDEDLTELKGAQSAKKPAPQASFDEDFGAMEDEAPVSASATEDEGLVMDDDLSFDGLEADTSGIEAEDLAFSGNSALAEDSLDEDISPALEGRDDLGASLQDEPSFDEESFAVEETRVSTPSARDDDDSVFDALEDSEPSLTEDALSLLNEEPSLDEEKPASIEVAEDDQEDLDLDAAGFAEDEETHINIRSESKKAPADDDDISLYPKTAKATRHDSGVNASSQVNEALLRLSLSFSDEAVDGVLEECFANLGMAACLFRKGTGRRYASASSQGRSASAEAMIFLASKVKDGSWTAVTLEKKMSWTAAALSLQVLKISGGSWVWAHEKAGDMDVLRETVASLLAQLEAK